MNRLEFLIVGIMLLFAAIGGAQEDVADVPSQDLKANGDEKKRYFFIGPAKDAKPPAKGFGLVVILPGGDGSAEFHPFVKRIFKHALGNEYLVAQLVAIKWTPNQQVVWPTEKLKAEQMKFSTEAFIEDVIEDAGKKHKIDKGRTFVLGWSSGGPAAYAISLKQPSPVAGSFIAMSVFRPDWLPPLKDAKDRAYFLYHSPDDRVCPYRMAEQAVKDLKKNGAKVKLQTYEGGHGWRGPLYQHIREGVQWLEKNRTRE
jgi:predicted esterase